MAQDYTTGYAEIVKYDKNDDGTLMVFGKATDDTLDLDSQICDPKWLDTAMPQWFKSGGNIREMHGPSAAGIAKEYEAKNDGHYIGVHVVDPIAAKKVETGVYQGFSIGIKSPRVVRDSKAANGRIIDGQIIEVSLVDRPANPSAKLILAKSIEGESSLIQVEELHEFKAPLPSDLFKKEPDYDAMHEGGDNSEPADKELYSRVKAEAKRKFDVYPSAVANAWVVREYKKRGGKYQRKTKKMDDAEKGSKMETIKQITELAKSLTPDSAKFDKDLFDKARKALADLIVVEANEMTTEGSDERMSISHLMEAVNHLLAWYEGEEAEGEVTEMEEVEKAADMPICEDGKCGKCAECMSDKADMPDCADGKCGKCAKCMSEKAPEVPDTTEEEETDQATIKSVDAEVVEEAPVAEEAPVVAEEISEAVEATDTTSLEDVVEKAVKSAMESVKAEIDTLRAEKESAVEKSVKLESELATALSKSVAGGPKRTATKMSDEAQNDMLVKAATYKAKADATTDPVLAKGYRDLANDFFAKANPKSEN
jgi:hypothetical protein